MKKVRKGFTLVELLIVIAIMGSLAAAMSTSSGNATARAKAASIVANVEACKTAAAIFYNDHWDDATVKVKATSDGTEENTHMADTTAGAFLGNFADGYDYVPNWSDFTTEGGSIIFGVDTGQGRDNWGITVSFANDAEATNIQKALVKMKGYSVVTNNTTSFKVNLTTGKVTVDAGGGGGGGGGGTP